MRVGGVGAQLPADHLRHCEDQRKPSGGLLLLKIRVVLWRTVSILTMTNKDHLTCFWSAAGPLDSTLWALDLLSVVSAKLKHSGAGEGKHGS